jgi:hypothetical protein
MAREMLDGGVGRLSTWLMLCVSVELVGFFLMCAAASAPVLELQ